MSTDEATAEEDSVSILSFDNLEEDYALLGSDGRIHHWLSQQCRFGLEEKEIPTPYEIGGPGELLSNVLAKHRDSSSTVSEEGGEAALRADSPLLGFGIDDERTLVDPLHFPSATYVRDLPDYRAPSSRSRSTSTSSSSPRNLGLLSLSRRPSLLRQPSLPLLGELDDESQPQAIFSPLLLPVTPPQPGRSRAHSNASISSFHLPTSMQLSHQITPPLTPISPPSPFVWRHTRKPNTPSVSSTLASFSFGNSPGGARTRPHSQLHGHGPFLHPAHRHPPAPPQKIPHTLSRSSSALSLSLSTNNRNAVYIDELIDIDSGADEPVAEGGESLSVDLGVKSGDDDRLQVRNEEGYHTPLIPPTNTPNTSGVYFNALRSSQIYLGIGTKKAPTRPPPAPPLIIDDKGGLGGVGVIDEDAIEDQFPAKDRSTDGGVYSHQHNHRQPHVSLHQHIQFEETDAEHDDSEGEDNKPFMSRWSLTSSIDEIPTPASSTGSSVVAAFGVGGGGGGGGGLFGSRKRMSFGGDKIDKARGAEDEKEKDDEEKEKVPKFTEKLGPIEVKEKEKEKEKEKSMDKKRGRLVSFISRISSNMMAPPPPTTTFQNTPFQNVTRLSSY